MMNKVDFGCPNCVETAARVVKPRNCRLIYEIDRKWLRCFNFLKYELCLKSYLVHSGCSIDHNFKMNLENFPCLSFVQRRRVRTSHPIS